jgi:hypothetical protein
MDTDDISLPNRFELQLEFMKNNPEKGLTHSWCERYFDRIDKSKLKTFDESLRVLVVATDEEDDVIGYQCWDLGTNALSTEGGFKATDVLAEDVTKDIITLSVYIYFDGEDTYAFTNNLDSTLSREITVSFAATEPTV